MTPNRDPELSDVNLLGNFVINKEIMKDIRIEFDIILKKGVIVDYKILHATVL